MERNAGGNFDWVAPLYDRLASIVYGQQLNQAQIVFLARIPPEAVVLIVGGGTGWLLEQVLTTARPKQVTYLEASARMVALTSRRLIRHAVVGSVIFQVGDETNLTEDERFDVIITPFVLDLYTETTLKTNLIPTLLSRLTARGSWLVTDFVRPARLGQKALLWTMIHFFRLTARVSVRQLADWQQCLLATGVVRRQWEPRVGGMVSTEVWTRP